MSVVIFHKIVSKQGHPTATLFYAFNPILLVSVHGGMIEPLHFMLVFGALLAFKNANGERSLMDLPFGRYTLTTILLALALIARPDFTIFPLLFFAIYGGRRFLPNFLLLIGVMVFHGGYLVMRFGLDHFISFTQGVGYGTSMLGFPFYNLFYSRFFGSVEPNAVPISGLNLIINETIAWTVIGAIALSLVIAYRRRDDEFSLMYLTYGSVVQPAYSYFAGFFRFISLTPYLYRLPSIFFKGWVLKVVMVGYVIGGLGLLMAWLF